MTQEVLKMALDFVENGYLSDWRGITERQLEVITAIKEALAKEKTLQALHDENERLGLYKDAYAEQKPIWWLVEYHDWAREFTPKKPEESIAAEKITALYTEPLQRTWVGLTDEDISKISQRFGIDHDDSWTDLKQAIEAKLKEKNT